MAVRVENQRNKAVLVRSATCRLVAGDASAG